jgi:3-oxoacyl-(acyl-carrier-protein) synthase
MLELAAGEIGLVVSSANGTFVDAAEKEAISAATPNAEVCSPKRGLGESVGASALWQVIIAAQALRSETAEAGPRPTLSRALVLSCGMNQQIGAVRLGV